MRYLRIFLLHFQNVLEYRSRIFVWFLVVLLNPLLYLLFWTGAYSEKGQIYANWSLTNIASYYFLIIIAGAILMAHIDYDIAYLDIQQGDLVRYLTRPLPYYLFKFFHELPWRLISGFFALIAFGCFFLLFGHFILLSSLPIILLLSLISSLLALLLSFTFKMIVGLTAFWITDIGGLQQLVEIVILIFSGFIIPLDFLPDALKTLSFSLPFAYMIYYPVIAFQGKMNGIELLRVIGVQCVWLIILYLFYVFIWNQGLKKFTGVGR